MPSLKKTLLSFVGDRLLAQATVSHVETLAPRFRMITLKSDSLATAKWSPGDKVQINVGNWNVRTYTPLSINRADQTIRVLAFIHGESPGAQWARNVSEGDRCQILGPQTSLDFGRLKTPVVFFGDETSFGAASVLRAEIDGEARFVFEADDPREADTVLNQIGFQPETVTIVQRSDRDKVAGAIRGALNRLNQAQIVLTGNASSIQALRAILKEQNLLQNTKAKAYWAAGKVGID